MPSLLVEFRKRFKDDVIREINEMRFAPEASNANGNSGDNGDSGDNSNSGTNDSNNDNNNPDPLNKGILIMDATCAPTNITYPQDIKLCNEAREKTEQMVEAMHERGNSEKPGLDKKKARRGYLKVAKSKKCGGNTTRKAIKNQLSYARRNLGYIGGLMGRYDRLSPKHKNELETIRTLYGQQKHMLDNRTHPVENRIVSISQPHVRPIVRGKAFAKTEFGSKVAISVINGYAFVDKVSWNACNEVTVLIPAIEKYRKNLAATPRP